MAPAPAPPHRPPGTITRPRGLRRSVPRWWPGPVVVVAALTFAGCGASSPTATAPPATGPATTATQGTSAATTARPAPPGSGTTGTSLRTGTTGTAPRTTPPRSSATLTRFDMPSNIACHGLTIVKVTATYATTGATSVAFLVDNEQLGADRIGAPPTSGSVELPLPCDGAAHTVVISAVDDQGRAAVMSRAVLTDDRQSGG